MAVLTREDTFYVPRYLAKLCGKRHKDIVCIIAATGYSPHLSLFDIFRISDPAAFFLKGIRYIVSTILGIFMPGDGRHFYSVRQMARYYRIPFKKNKRFDLA